MEKDPLLIHGSDVETSAGSAAAMVPVILQLTGARSVVDVGCGVGNWLAAFRANRIEDYMGVDGSHIPESTLLIHADRFVAMDLSVPLKLDRRFDLAISMEVGEHLPDSASRTFVQSLTELADVVVFSSAIPFQGGPAHINEQWPSYWAELFADFGYVATDCLRPLLWDRDEIGCYYRQNAIVYATPDTAKGLRTSVEPGVPLSLVHPAFWHAAHQTPAPPSVRALGAYVGFHGRQVARSVGKAVKVRAT